MLLAAGLVVTAWVAWGLAGALLSGPRPPGDGSDPASYGFNLDHATIPVNEIFAAADHREAIRPLNHPAMINVAQVDRLNQSRRTRYLVPADRVIGVEINGEARCYPVRMLAWHEVVNDTVGGVPIAVTYNGLCDSIVVFDRRVLMESGRRVEGEGVGGAGVPPATPSAPIAAPLLRASGLLYNANPLLYAVPDVAGVRSGDAAAHTLDQPTVGGGESLWSQLRMSAVTGPAARDGLTLTPIPFTLARWADWSAAYPNTLVLTNVPDPAMQKRYKQRTYGEYFSSDALKPEIPVSPLPTDGRALKSRVIVVQPTDDPARRHVLMIDDLLASAATTSGGGGETTIVLDGVRLTVHVRPSEHEEPPTVWVMNDEGRSRLIAHSFWFAWFAAWPDLVSGPSESGDSFE